MNAEELLKHPVFKGITPATAKELLQSGETIELKPISRVFNESDKGDGLYLILEGQIRITKKDPASGRETDIAVLEPGEMFGELSAVDTDIRSATARAVAEAKVLKISKDQIESHWAANPEYGKILLNITRIIIQRLRNANQRMVDDAVWGKKDESESVTRMQAFISEKLEMRILLMGEREIFGKIKSVDIGLSGLPEMVLVDSTGHAFIIPFTAIQYIVKAGK